MVTHSPTTIKVNFQESFGHALIWRVAFRTSVYSGVKITD